MEQHILCEINHKSGLFRLKILYEVVRKATTQGKTSTRQKTQIGKTKWYK